MEVKTESGGTFNAAGTGSTALGIVGTVLGGLATAMAGGNGLGILNNNSNNKVEYATKDDIMYSQELAKKDNEISLLKSEQNTEIKIADVYERIMTRVNQDQRDQVAWNSAQMVNNATMSAAIATNTNSISALQTCCNQITKLVVPLTSVCPQPMPQYNSWTAPTTSNTTTN